MYPKRNSLTFQQLAIEFRSNCRNGVTFTDVNVPLIIKKLIFRKLQLDLRRFLKKLGYYFSKEIFKFISALL